MTDLGDELGNLQERRDRPVWNGNRCCERALEHCLPHVPQGILLWLGRDWDFIDVVNRSGHRPSGLF